ncbi:TauD/TfdA family dioxygenase [Candidatus Gracilibacteria bacterium]|nr:TauD/TfdA family dioxygenase [Candidatus Gracilibacteria bacterium]
MLKFEEKYKHIELKETKYLDIKQFEWNGNLSDIELEVFNKNGIIVIDKFQKNNNDLYSNFEKYFGNIIPQGKDLSNQSIQVKKKQGGKTYFESSRSQPLHSDGAYSTNYPKIIFLNCITQSKVGGESLILDGNKLLEFLEKYKLLNDILDKPFKIQRWGQVITKPLIYENKNSNRIEISYTPFLDKLIGESDRDEKIFAIIQRYINNSKNHQYFKLRSNQLLIIDNTRYLHGRRFFEDNEERCLERVWFNGE